VTVRIAAIAHAVPGRQTTNAEVVALVREQSRPRIGSERADSVGDLVARFLDAAGTDVRYRLADDEKAIDVVLRASRDALAEAGVATGDVDLVLYTGVARGWMEPATATVVSQPVITNRFVSGTDFILQGSGGTPLLAYTVLDSTNVALPRTNWTSVGVSTFDSSGDFSFTHTNGFSLSTNRLFYSIQVP